MQNQLINCKNCNLCLNQKPLLDTLKKADIMWVGLSAKSVDNFDRSIPLNNDTNSGKIIEMIEKKLPKYSFYKTNLVKCLPLDNSKKLRYPDVNEMNKCINNLLYEIEIVKPNVIFILGKQAYNFIDNYINKNELHISNYYYVEHPSYIYIYKKKYINEYIDKIIKICEKL